MAKRKGKAKRATGAHARDEFNALMRRFLAAVNHLQLVSQHFDDLSAVPKERVPACFVVTTVSEDLDQLYDAFDRWNVSHDHAMEAQQS